MPDQVKINFITDAQTENDSPVNVPQPLNRPVLSRGDSSSNQTKPIRPQRPRRRGKIKKIFAGLVIIFIIAFAVFASSVAFSNENLIKNLVDLNWLGQIGGLIVSGERPLQGEQNDRINIILMGIGGGTHDGANLTDTMILGTYKPSTKQFAMVSIPRDLYVKIPSVGWGKINSVNAYAEKRQAKSGGEEVRKFLSDLLGSEMGYYVVIDFDGFEKLIDEFGGIDVYVENDLIDYSYPITGKEDVYPIESRYEKLVIKKGWHHFDGATALKYTRSRHAIGGEGSDFARSSRQQRVLLALKDKIFKYNFLLNPTKISSLLDAYNKNVNTNLQMWEILKLAKLMQDADYEHPISYSLVDGKSPLLYDQMINGSYALLPYGGNFDKIEFVWQNIFTVGTSTLNIDYTKWAEFKDQPTSTKATTTLATSTPIKATSTNTVAPFSNENPSPANTLPIAQPAKEKTFQDEKARIEVQNGTMIEGWAGKEATKLRNLGFNVVSTGNALTKGYTAIKIYDFSGGKYSLTVSELQVIYGVSAVPPPAGLKSNGSILIILGK